MTYEVTFVTDENGTRIRRENHGYAPADLIHLFSVSILDILSQMKGFAKPTIVNTERVVVVDSNTNAVVEGEPSKTMKYKLRAECSNDVAQFIMKAHSQMTNFKMQKDEELPDVEFDFETELAIDEIIMTLQDIDDSHVMYQTVQPIDKYTGERDYNL